MIRRISIKLSQQQQHQIQRKLLHQTNSKCFHTKIQPLSTAAIQHDDDDNNDVVLQKNQHFPNLFSPLDLGPAIGSLPNRVMMGSMHTGLEVS